MPPDDVKPADGQINPDDQINPDIGLVPDEVRMAETGDDGPARRSQESGPNEGLPRDEESQEAVARDSDSFLSDALNLLRGFCMGAANIVPGVSGGTVALVLGHYQRLIDAVSRIDSQLAKQVFRRRWKSAWDYVDARFLLGIGVGVVIGSVALAGLMNWLFTYHMSQTFAVFLGMIVASVWIVRRQIDSWRPLCFVSCALGVLVAVIIGRLSPTDGGDSLVYLFFSAAIAICAMILPGISGAFILLLLGVYHPITELIKNVARGDITLQSAMQFSVFGFGCLFGLLAFSRTLSWMLDHHRSLTMAGLVGLMVGSLEKLWPLQIPTPETASLKMKERVMQHVAPAEWEGSLTVLFLLALGSALFVLALEKIATVQPGIAGDAELNRRENDG